MFDLPDCLCNWGRSPWIEMKWLTIWLADCLYWMIWSTEPTSLTELIYQANYLIGRTSEQWYQYWSDLNQLNQTKDPSRMMAQPNDIPGPSSQPHNGKEPEQTEQTEPNQCSSIMIDGDEEEEPNQYKVTFEDSWDTSTSNLNSFMESSEWSMNNMKMLLKTAKPDLLTLNWVGRLKIVRLSWWRTDLMKPLNTRTRWLLTVMHMPFFL